MSSWVLALGVGFFGFGDIGISVGSFDVGNISISGVDGHVEHTGWHMLLR